MKSYRKHQAPKQSRAALNPHIRVPASGLPPVCVAHGTCVERRGASDSSLTTSDPVASFLVPNNTKRLSLAPFVRARWVSAGPRPREGPACGHSPAVPWSSSLRMLRSCCPPSDRQGRRAPGVCAIAGAHTTALTGSKAGCSPHNHPWLPSFSTSPVSGGKNQSMNEQWRTNPMTGWNQT